MDMHGLALICLGILLFAGISKFLQKSSISAPMIFVVLGFGLSPLGLDEIQLGMDNNVVYHLAQITLVLLLFSDALRIPIRQLKRAQSIPIRLLTIGLPLLIVFAIPVGGLLLPQLSWLEIIMLAIILAPTDAALAQSVINSQGIPMRIRQALNVESGLNDGIALPFLLVALSLGWATHTEHVGSALLLALVLQLCLGPLFGIVIGYLGGQLIVWGQTNAWMTRSFQGITLLTLPVLALSGAEVIGGNGFLAAFCAGLTLGNSVPKLSHALQDFTETEGQLLTLLTFLFFGALIVPPALPYVTWSVVMYALLSLLVLRGIATTISLYGEQLHPVSLIFIGWFGPRGIASVVYLILVLRETGSLHPLLLATTVLTILLSIFLHGLTALPAALWYSQHPCLQDEQRTEHLTVPVMPVRIPWR